MKIKPAQATLNELNEGRVLTDLAQAIHDGIAAVKAHGKPGVVTLSITIDTMKGKHTLVQPPLLLSGEVTTKLPKAPPPVTVFYEDEDGNPTRIQVREPQLNLSIATVDKNTGEING